MVKIVEVLATLVVLVGYLWFVLWRRRPGRRPATVLQLAGCLLIGTFFMAAAVFGLATDNTTYAVWGFVAALFLFAVALRVSRSGPSRRFPAGPSGRGRGPGPR